MQAASTQSNEISGEAVQPAEASPAPGSQSALFCDMELPLSGFFYPLGYAVEIITNEPSILLAAEQTFCHARPTRQSSTLQVRIGVTGGSNSACPPEPRRRAFNHLYSLVADPENQALLDLKSATNFVWLTKAAINNVLYLRYNFLEKVVYLLLGATVVTDMHAACIGKHGKGILLCGDSGAGKSTLAYACARQGWTYTSDDTSYLINDSDPPRVTGHCHRARFRPSSTLLFPELEGRPLTPRMEGKPSIEVPTAELPIRLTAESTVHSIVYLNRYRGAVAGLEKLPDGTATQRARRELYSAGEIRAKHEVILERLWRIPTYNLRYCDLEDGVNMLDRLVREI